MSTDKLKRLMAGCKCGVYVTVNEHRDVYESAQDALNHMWADPDPDVLQRMIETNTIVSVQFYPDTPIGSYTIIHWDLDAALDAALDCLERRP